MLDIMRRLERMNSMDEDHLERLEHMMMELLRRIPSLFNQGTVRNSCIIIIIFYNLYVF